MRDLTVEAPALEEGSSKKFGTFLGVFTPSILTILGVIMYQRFGWVVGNQGLVGALLIVGLAHVISFTTGLSVASIATNRAVKTGGNYYILSRSLGLSIGGAIGLALYIALALGVSLYLIGFAEAFIAVFQDYLPFASELDNIRLLGSAALVALALLTLASTSIALKSQLFVLFLIVVSLLAIFFGNEVMPLPGETAVAYGPPENGASFSEVFAVFFPAVTGFTAGVGMSGDLKDPKRAIPLGTMGAILVGFLIYATLPLFLSEVATTQQLMLDKNILLRIAPNKYFVTAGVFAATISSALGSILGAPRTLQALAFDRIVPKFLGRGRDEPRIALIVTILIAEAGILVGELDVVGAVISMFFLTCYGFLCLACGLERWASPDFRPQFRVPIWVSLIGAVACFLVMFQIDPLAMFASIIVMALFYLFLKSRQLELGGGDTWGGVWSAVVRFGLMKLRDSKGHVRNWRPNMLAVARPRAREALIGFGRSVVGDRGILTHFDFIRGGSKQVQIDRKLEDEYPGMFARTQGCDDPFDAIPNLAAHSGLAAMETNVMLVGWPQEEQPGQNYAKMIARLLELDLSVLMLRHDPERKYGKRERVDIWWDGIAPAGQLMLTLGHFLLSSAQWKDAKVRLLVTGRPGTDEAAVTRRLEEIVQDSRVRAEAILLAPLASAGSLADRIRQESAGSDFVMVHAIEGTESEPFFLANDNLIRSLGTTLLVRPASIFEQGPIAFDLDEPERAAEDSIPPELPLEIQLPAGHAITPIAERLNLQVIEAIERFNKSVEEPAIEEERSFIEKIVQEVEQIRQVERRLGRRGRRREAARGLVDWARQRFQSAAVSRVRDFIAPKVKRPGSELVLETAWENRLRRGIARLRKDLSEALLSLPTYVSIPTEPEDWRAQPGDAFWFRLLKFWTRAKMRLGGRPPDRRLPVRSVAADYLGTGLNMKLERAAREVGIRRCESIQRVRRLVANVDRFFENLLAELTHPSDEALDLESFKALVSREVVGMEDVAFGVLDLYDEHSVQATQQVAGALKQSTQALFEELKRPELAYESREGLTSKEIKAQRRAQEVMAGLPATWTGQHGLVAGALLLDIHVASLKLESRRALQQLFQRIRHEIETGPMEAIQQAATIMRRVMELQEQQELQGSDDVEDKPEDAASGSGSVESEPAAEGDDDGGVEKAFLEAADQLRGTWAEPYQPRPREWIEQLLIALGRAAERLPESIQTTDEAALEKAGAGTPARAAESYRVRRLAHAFLEKSIIQPIRRTLGTIPNRIAQAESDLVDASRLVAFELEQAAGAKGEDGGSELEFEVDEAGQLAIGGVLTERIQRLEAEEAAIGDLLAELRTSLVEEKVRVLDEARLALTGVGAGTGQPLGIPSREVIRDFRAAIRKVEGQVGAAVDLLSNRDGAAARRTGRGSTLADDLLALREALVPNPEVQASLPLIYRRIFGRAPLETSNLLHGREQQLEDLERLIGRWGAGTGGPIGIIGDPRSGRTSLANIITRELVGDRMVHRVVPEAGGAASAEEVNRAVVRAVGAREGQAAEGALRAMPPGAVIVLDNLGRWFERAPNGLGGLSLWMRLFRRLGDRHLFVVTSTPFAWGYVEQLLGIRSCFLGTTHCTPVPPVALRRLLDLRQRTSDFALAFTAPSRFSAVKRALLYSQRQQHKRIYERSRGNVGNALDLWRRHITQVGERRVEISVGPTPSLAALSRIPIEWQAALASIALHRTVSVARLSRIMRIGREEAMGLLADMERARLLVLERSGGWGLDPVLLPHVLEALREKGVLS